MKDGVYTRMTHHCIRCGHRISIPYSLPVELNGPLCDDCEKREPPPAEKSPPPLDGLPF